MTKYATKHPAIIDIGSNSVRLVVYETLERCSQIFYNEKVVCRLGKLKKDNYLLETAKDCTLETLLRFKQIAMSMQAEVFEIVATAALRDAVDGGEFAKLIESKIGLPIRILSGKEEALYAAKGIIYHYVDAKGVVADLGGGSLELAHLTDNDVKDGLTLPLGVLRVQNDVCEPFDIKRYSTHIQKVFSENLEGFFAKEKNLYCVGGAWRALALYYMQEVGYSPVLGHGFSLRKSSLLPILQDILDNPQTILKSKIAGVSKRRLSSMPLAALLLQKLLVQAEFETIIFSHCGIREGLLFEHLSLEERAKDPVISFVKRKNDHAARLPELAPHLYEAIKPLFEGESQKLFKLLEIFCYVSDIAWRRHPDHRADYVFDHLLYSDIPDLDHSERLFIAYAAAIRHQSDFSLNENMAFHAQFTPKLQFLSKMAGLAARYLYTATGFSPEYLKNISISKGSSKVIVHIQGAMLPQGENTQKRYDMLGKHIYEAFNE